MPAACRKSRFGVVFFGQSLNLVPTSSPYPNQTMAGRTETWANAGVGAYAWLTLIGETTLRLGPFANMATKTILVMCGGSSDYVFNRTGAQVYADEGTIAANARALGYDYVINTTTTPAEIPTWFSTTQDTRRQDGNTLTLADASLYFNAVVDFSTILPLSAPNYPDGIHPSVAGAGTLAASMKTALDVAVAALS